MNQAYELILERIKDPVNQGTLKDPHISIKDSNPLCGDELEIFLKFENGKVQDMKFMAKGCSISRASVDILAEYVAQKKFSEVLNMTNKEMIDLVGIDISPMRLKCALLGLVALKKGIKEYENGIGN